MFGRSSRPVVIDRYASRRRRLALPRWLWLLALGAALGIAGVLYVQQSHLPPRLSAAESSKLQADYAGADAERTRLADELAAARAKLDQALAAQQQAGGEAASLRRERDALRASVATLIDYLPPDPRGGAVEVRAAQLQADGERLRYDVLLTRPQAAAAGSPLDGVLQLVVAGKTARGSESTVTLPAVEVRVGRVEIARGELALPAGFVARQATVRVLERVDGRALGMRVIRVQ